MKREAEIRIFGFMVYLFDGTRIITDAADFQRLFIRVDPQNSRNPRAIVIQK
jgi:hypothetical protein